MEANWLERNHLWESISKWARRVVYIEIRAHWPTCSGSKVSETRWQWTLGGSYLGMKWQYIYIYIFGGLFTIFDCSDVQIHGGCVSKRCRAGIPVRRLCRRQPFPFGRRKRFRWFWLFSLALVKFPRATSLASKLSLDSHGHFLNRCLPMIIYFNKLQPRCPQMSVTVAGPSVAAVNKRPCARIRRN